MRRRHAVSLLLTVVFMASACSGDPGSNEGTTGDGAGAVDSAPDDASSRTTLELALEQEPTPLTPCDTGTETNRPIWQATHEALLETDPESQLASGILDSWEFSQDGRTITFTLKPNIEWSDGTPMTSADVVMSLTHCLDPRISAHAGRLAGVTGVDAFADGSADSISGLSAPDELTVVVELDEPDAGWLPSFAQVGDVIPPLPAHILGDVANEDLADHEFFQTHPVSSGPYQFVELVSGQHVELQRNPNWSLGEAGFERVFFKAIPASEVRAAQLETSEVQFILNVSPVDVERIGSIDGVEVESVPGVSPYFFGPMYYEPLSDPRVRQAMVYALDREGICQQVFEGHCTVSTQATTLVGPEWALPSDLVEYSYDPDRARQLLDEAGWVAGTELTAYDPIDDPVADAVIAIAQDNLADVGMDWSIVDSDIPTMLTAVEGGGSELQGWFVGGGNFGIDPDEIRSRRSCSTQYPDGSNLVHYCDPELDEMFDAARRVTDQESRADIYHEAFRKLNQNPYYIPLYVPDQLVAYSSQLKGVEVYSDGHHYRGIGNWTWED